MSEFVLVTRTSANKQSDECKEARGHKKEILKVSSVSGSLRSFDPSNKARHRQPRLGDVGPDDAYTVETQLHWCHSQIFTACSTAFQNSGGRSCEILREQPSAQVKYLQIAGRIWKSASITLDVIT